ncbi:MAG: MBOAT family protein [Candidatus Hydrogenedentes bacterium]|nr:MBOAT family protein [Candidatus Hydrogenedentota bacterium]
MLFNSFVFVFFLAIVLPVYYRLSHAWQNRFLVVASYVFYGWWDWRFLSLLAVSTAVDYVAAQAIEATRSVARKRLWLFSSLVANLGILGFFKYFNFFVDSFSRVLVSLGLNPNPPVLSIVLPVGISFYTFQTMAYTIDVYRGQQHATRNLVNFALYVSYFPQLVAGPIERASRLLTQIERPRRVGQDQIASAAQLILWGYVKKVAIADGLASYVDIAFQKPMELGAGALWIGLYAFAIQIYCDFSGYSDIARGVSRLMGVELMENFRQPYVSANITEFWRRWHISLSTWLRDYLYISLGGNRKGPMAQYQNLIVTMLLGGLWHGANWTFVAWGGLHGLYLALHKLITRGRKISETPPPNTLRSWSVQIVKMLVTFHLVCVTWVLFRSPNMETAYLYLGGLISPLFPFFERTTTPEFIGAFWTLLFYGAFAIMLDLGCWLGNHETCTPPRMRWWVRGAAYATGLLILSFVRAPSGEAFIYFQF